MIYRIWETVTNSNESFIYTYHSTRNLTLIPNLKSNLCLPTHLRENRVFKNLRGRNLMFIESALKFKFEICAYFDTCLISNSRIAKVKKKTFRNYVILRNRGIIKLQ